MGTFVGEVVAIVSAGVTSNWWRTHVTLFVFVCHLPRYRGEEYTLIRYVRCYRNGIIYNARSSEHVRQGKFTRPYSGRTPRIRLPVPEFCLCQCQCRTIYLVRFSFFFISARRSTNALRKCSRWTRACCKECGRGRVLVSIFSIS